MYTFIHGQCPSRFFVSFQFVDGSAVKVSALSTLAIDAAFASLLPSPVLGSWRRCFSPEQGILHDVSFTTPLVLAANFVPWPCAPHSGNGCGSPADGSITTWLIKCIVGCDGTDRGDFLGPDRFAAGPH